MRFVTFVPVAIMVFCALSATVSAVDPVSQNDKITHEQEQFFESKIRPVLVRECYGCHSSKSGNVRGGLRLDTQALTHIGGSSGPAVVPGDLDASLLFNAITYEDFEMPPKRRLSDRIIEDFRKWIEMGAPDPRQSETVAIKSSITDKDIELARETFWAYRAPVKQDPPVLESGTWAKSAVDQFVAAKLSDRELEPAADAEPAVVLRRLCFDLVGLPPTPKQLEVFGQMWQSDPQAAIAHVVDRLLETPQFGERWGRHWLDIARYAESTGREINVTYPHAWRYRDYVIDSFNADKPFNEFVQEQVAGDLLPAESDAQWAEHLVATTFLAIGPKNVNEQNRVQFQADLVDEQIDATSRVFLGTSVACARCHDHKFDPIPQADYYAWAGIFANMTTYFGNPPSKYGAISTAQRKRQSSLIRLPVDDPSPFDPRYSKSELDELEQQLKDTLAEAAGSRRSGQMTAAELRARLARLNRMSELSARLAVVDSDGQPISYCMGVQERQPPRDVPLLVRGEIDQRTKLVARGLPQVLTSSKIPIAADESGRLQLAQWLGSKDNPLTARVYVNRVWQHMLGKAIVRTPENFGATGLQPTHPELLDYLAVSFVENGWSTKKLIRTIALSRVYRMSSAFDSASHQEDPDNELLWRANPRRLEAEAIRDAMLMASGKLDLQRPRGSEVAKAGFTDIRGGVLGDAREEIRKAIDEQAQEMRRSLSRSNFGNRRGQGRLALGRGGGQDSMRDIISDATRKVTNRLDMEDATMRSVYLPIVRNEEPRSLEVFDFVDSSSVTGQREQSHTANQALYMLNNRFVETQAQAFAKRLLEETETTAEAVRLGFLVALGRQATADELAAASRYLRSFGVRRGVTQEAMAAFCGSLFATAEFRMLD